MRAMFKQLFATMNEVLDAIMTQYPTAVGAKKNELAEQLTVLKAMSETFVEEWLLFEEKLSKWEEGQDTPHDMALNEFAASQCQLDEFKRGEGYFKLYMFENAIKEFEQVIEKQPDFLLARLFLALGYLQVGEIAESYRHFQFIVPMANSSKMKAISLNALGCIQAKNDNFEKAYEYFKMAYKADPSLPDPLVNMGVCLHNEGTLQYGSGLII
jgi:tetratricopeptide (TPR) repeat protein